MHGDDFSIVGRQEGRKHALSLLRGAYELSNVVTLGPESSQSQTGSFLGKTPTLRQWRLEYEPDQQHVSRALKALGVANAQGVVSPGTDDVGGPKASVFSELRRIGKNGTILRKRSERRRIVLTGEELKPISEGGGKIQFPCDGQARPCVFSKRNCCGKWLHHASGTGQTSLPSTELLDTRSNTRE